MTVEDNSRPQIQTEGASLLPHEILQQLLFVSLVRFDKIVCSLLRGLRMEQITQSYY
jgi:hypothetical protein